ncbi:GIDE domain-containing protein [Yinghuangia seranimata]|uniref:GIDE domain-containing protein n=1 Tax=Yinghuangia seranimata TaxID=408067 RepID=UPI00248C9724|nr:GIDE domain-containing protein [Yinghuangia seranimata]MDI2132508.1 GIDE domain-containing protein [Yinghuangia seranimata]
MVTLGVIALVVAVVGFAAARFAPWATRTPRLTCEDAAAHRGRATVAGVVEPLPGGLVYAPVSGRSCVWFTSTVVESWAEADRLSVRDFDGDGPLHVGELRPARRGRSRAETKASRRTFVLRDDTGTVLVDPDGLRADRLPVSVRDSIGGAGTPRFGGVGGVVAVDFAAGAARRVRRATRYDRTETLLVPGERVFLTGRVVRRSDGVAVLGGPAMVVSRRSPEDVARTCLRARAGWALGALSGLFGVVALVAAARH